MKKNLRFLPLLAAAGVVALAPFASAQDAKKVLATSAALHPGTKKKHEAFNEISKKSEAELVFLGDSITAGWAGRGRAVWAEKWTPLKAANFGIGGDRTEHIIWRLQNGNYDGLNAKLTVLMIGTNNTGHEGREMKEHGGVKYSSPAEDTAKGVEEIIKILRKKQPEMKILLLAIFPRGADTSHPMRIQNEETNALISKLADGETVHWLNINQAFLQSDGVLTKEIMPDLLHLSEEGYAIWAKEIEAKVKELLVK